MTCAALGCDAEPVLAVRTTAPRNSDGIVSTLYQFPEDAPKTASRYCMKHGIDLLSGLARLSDGG